MELQDIDVIDDLPEPFKNETKDSPFGQGVLEGNETDLIHCETRKVHRWQ